ncbi:MAG TPA: hypothetical protein PLB57_02305, partial [bacterium]|nr:hypothetical protein [bacterium]
MKRGYYIIIVVFLMFLSNSQQAQAISFMNDAVPYDSSGAPNIVEQDLEEFCLQNPSHPACHEYYNDIFHNNNINPTNNEVITDETTNSDDDKPKLIIPELEITLPGLLFSDENKI